SSSSPKALGRCSATCGSFRQWHHAARAKFLAQSASANPRAKSLNSVGKASCESATIVVVVCEDGSPLAFFEAKPRSDVPSTPAGVTGPSSLERKIAADTPVTSGRFLDCSAARLPRKIVMRVTPCALAFAAVELASYSPRDRATLARRLRFLAIRSRRLRSSLRARFLTLTLPIVVRRKACRWA